MDVSLFDLSKCLIIDNLIAHICVAAVLTHRETYYWNAPLNTLLKGKNYIPARLAYALHDRLMFLLVVRSRPNKLLLYVSLHK